MASAKLLRFMKPSQKLIIGYPLSSGSIFFAYASGVGLAVVLETGVLELDGLSGVSISYLGLEIGCT